MKEHIQDNHFVPQSYLRRWSADGYKIWARRLLVPHANVPHWSPHSIFGIAKAKNLYTMASKSGESDGVERWLNDEYESPAQEAITKAISDGELTEEDLRLLVRYVAAQSVRTPAYLGELMQWAERTLQKAMQESMDASVNKFIAAKQNGEILKAEAGLHSEMLPLHIHTDYDPAMGESVLKSTIVIGRAYWMYAMKVMLGWAASQLHFHRWTVLKSPIDMNWITTDNPVVRLRPRSAKGDWFKAGWAEPNAQFFMPLGPRHLLYTVVDQVPPPYGKVLPAREAEFFQRAMVDNAWRNIYASDQNSQVTSMRSRVEDAVAFEQDLQQWAKWHDEQSAAEREYFD